MTGKSFEEILLEAVDEALASLGDSAKQSIYYHLEKIFGIGARFLEILIMKKLYDRIGKPLEWNERKEFVFVNYVEAARQSFKKRVRVKR